MIGRNRLLFRITWWLSLGPNNIPVQATDAATNDELTPASYSWTQN